MQTIVGIDIGGTKCAVSFARLQDDTILFLHKVKIETPTDDFDLAMRSFIRIIRETFQEHQSWKLSAIGISCGGPLDAQRGLILAPPNLPHWDGVDVFTPLKMEFKVPIMMQNDADACALAEWSLGAGKGCRNMIFLTFGTGMGAGLILNNELYSGSLGMAGEIGHIRMEEDGPCAYGKRGSFEGFCSGGGIASLGRMKAKEALDAGKAPLFCRCESELDSISSKTIAKAAGQGDALAIEIFDTVGAYLGKGLAVLIDLLNPDRIVLGSIFVRQEAMLRESMMRYLKREALPGSARHCRIVPASLGEMIGDYAAVSVGIKAYRDLYKVEVPPSAAL